MVGSSYCCLTHITHNTKKVPPFFFSYYQNNIAQSRSKICYVKSYHPYHLTNFNNTEHISTSMQCSNVQINIKKLK